MGAPQDSIGPDTRDQDWIALIRDAARGDQSALGALYDATSRLVFGLVLRIVGDSSTAEEVLLDVYTQAWRQAGNYDEKRGAPLAWLMTIARSRAIDRLRGGKHERNRDPLDSIAEISDTNPSPEQATVNSERQRFVRSALAALPAEQREVVELAYYSGLSHSEIALRLGQPLGTVKTRTRLAMIKLRDMLQPVLGAQL